MERESSERYGAGLTRALKALRETHQHDQDAAWHAALDILPWLYRWENAEKKADPNYLAERAASVDGRTLGALIWLRGVIDHQQGKIDEALEVIVDGEPMTVDGVPVTVASELRWRSLSDLPSVVDTGNNRRHEWYEALVQGRAFLEPLESAYRFVLSRS